MYETAAAGERVCLPVHVPLCRVDAKSTSSSTIYGYANNNYKNIQVLSSCHIRSPEEKINLLVVATLTKHFDVTTSYKLVCRVTLQETALRSAHVMLTMRASERHASLPLGHGNQFFLIIKIDYRRRILPICTVSTKTALATRRPSSGRVVKRGWPHTAGRAREPRQLDRFMMRPLSYLPSLVGATPRKRQSLRSSIRRQYSAAAPARTTAERHLFMFRLPANDDSSEGSRSTQ
ncbi:hypothetical protein EVAR_11432_1 [Eumeta japonica]|uniref:Uncharacterized protein n=1 Tax=Eumeta variegata TaxID=151549 RepID=A0A4C1TKV0_EUMVA|nr:hypothetical protein EVAR_11432_1 [Eumeta japonica]